MDILITEDLQSPMIDRLVENVSVHRDATLWKDQARLKSALADARTVMVRNQTQLTAEILAAAPKLLGIGRVGVGLTTSTCRRPPRAASWSWRRSRRTR